MVNKNNSLAISNIRPEKQPKRAKMIEERMALAIELYKVLQEALKEKLLVVK